MLYFAIGVAGAVGALLRYFVGVFSYSLLVNDFPFGTLLCNVLGSYMLGWFYTYAANNMFAAPIVRTAIGTGLIGSFTTFSAFSAETVVMVQERRWLFAAIYISVSLWGGLAAAWLGYRIGRYRRRSQGKSQAEEE
jgi:CrcB protein